MSRILKFASLALVTCCLPASTHAASLRISGTIPVTCEARMVSSDIRGHRLTIFIQRTCNTWHSLNLRGDHADGLGNINFRYNGDVLPSQGIGARFDPPERFYDGTDQLTIEASAGNEADLERFARSLRLELETR